MLGAATVGLAASQLLPPGGRALADVPTSSGSALASASILTVGPSYEGLSVTVTAGSSVASYQSAESQATSQLIDAAALSGLTSSAPSLPISQGVTATSTNGAVTKSSGVPEIGSQSISVDPSPESASATTQVVGINIPGLVSIEGESTASVGYQAGQEQSADATSTVSITLGGGLVKLDGLTWKASQHTGSTQLATVTFTPSSITVGGHSLPVVGASQLTAALAAANKALAPISLALLIPAASTDPTSGTVTESALDLRLSRSALTNDLIAPLLGPISQVESEITKALLAGGSGLSSVAGDVGTGEFLGALVLDILAGAGQVNLLVGGVSADTQNAPAYVDPFGAPGTATSGASGGSFPATAGTLDSGIGLGGSNPSGPSGAGPTTTATTVAPATASAAPAAASAAVVVRCTTTSPAGHTGCWEGVAKLAAIGLFGAGIVLFAVDVYMGRRRRFRVVKEVDL